MAQQGGNPIELYEAAAQGFRQTLSGVREDQMNSSTPCTEWNVQALITHNLKTQGLAYGGLLENITVNNQEVSDPLPTEGAVAAFDAGVAQVLELIKAPGFLDNQIETPFGPMSRVDFLMIPVEDLVIHKWDLAKATNQDTSMDARLAEVAYEVLAPVVEAYRPAGYYAPEATVPISASIQEKLLALSGRQP